MSEEDINDKRITTRVQFELHEPAMNDLRALQKQLGAVSYAETVRRAIKLHRTLLRYQGSGNEICVRDKDGNIQKIVIM